jgi:hypothetical protein
MDLIYRDRIGETYAVKHSPAHRWLYIPGMRPNEVLLFRTYDSSRDGTPAAGPEGKFLP